MENNKVAHHGVQSKPVAATWPKRKEERSKGTLLLPCAGNGKFEESSRLLLLGRPITGYLGVPRPVMSPIIMHCGLHTLHSIAAEVNMSGQAGPTFSLHK